MVRNEVKAKIAEGKTVFGVYVHIPSPAIIEPLALSGLDFVRLDPYHASYTRETLENMTRAAYGIGVTPWARVRNDPWEIMTTLDAGVQIITVPNVGTADEARRAVSAAHYPPHGERESNRPNRFRHFTDAEYLDWVEREVWVSVQIEGRNGIENYQEIIAVDGVNVIQTGGNDIALALGLTGTGLGRFHPKVLEIEARIADAALTAGKQVSLNTDLSPRGLEYVQSWIDKGVRIFTLGIDAVAIMNAFRVFLSNFHAAEKT